MGIPAAARADASSPPRPKTNGSPPLRRTTRRPLRACAIMIALISTCDVDGPPGVFPTAMSSASLASRSKAADTSRSWSTTSACCSASAPATVISRGSPGPAPTSRTGWISDEDSVIKSDPPPSVGLRRAQAMSLRPPRRRLRDLRLFVATRSALPRPRS